MAITLDELMRELCEAAADAVYRYADVSGEMAHDTGLVMPESFVAGFVFDKLGSKLGSKVSMTLETNTHTLARHNEDAKARHSARRFNQTAVDVALKKLGGRKRKIDLVVYQGESPKKDEHDPFALVEFKLLKLGRDRERLLDILEVIDVCPYGVVCRVLSVKDEARRSVLTGEKSRALGDGDIWHERDVRDLPHGNTEPFRVCARGFRRRNAKGPAAQI